jgi:hypothetical protein
MAEHNGPKTPVELETIGDDRWLSMFTKTHLSGRIFSWKVIEKKWPGFEEAFEGFDTSPASPSCRMRLLRRFSTTRPSCAMP